MKRYQNEKAFLSAVRDLATTVLKNEAFRIDKDDEISDDVMNAVAACGLLALDSLGNGRNLSLAPRARLIVHAIEELAGASASIAKLVMDQNLGQVHLLRDCAQANVWSQYADSIRRGEAHVAFLMTEPHSGSSAKRFRCRARRVRGGYAIDGVKDWITGAEWRSLFLVVARVSATTFGLFLIDRSQVHDRGSIVVSARKRHVGLRGLGECRVTFRNCLVQHRHVVLEPNSSTLHRIMKYYNLKRCGQAGIAIGLSKAAMCQAYEYLRRRFRSRRKSGLPFQSQEFVFSEMFALVQASDQLNAWALERVLASFETDKGVKVGRQRVEPGSASSAAKLFCTESAVQITNWAVQLCGANGTLDELQLERYMRDARSLTTAGGTSEILRNTIARQLPAIVNGIS